jgi:hypothetical protein
MSQPTHPLLSGIAIELGERLEVGRRQCEEPEHETLKVATYLPPGVVRPSDRARVFSIPSDKVKFQKYEYPLESTNTKVGIGLEGLDRAYGIFGQTGCGKTPLMMHMLRQMLKLRNSDELHFGGLILDPKVEYYHAVREIVRDGGRDPDKILVPIGDHQKEAEALNIIHAPHLAPLNLGAALAMAAESAGIKSAEKSWMNELKTLFGAALHVLSTAYPSESPTLADMASSLLDDVDDPNGSAWAPIDVDGYPLAHQQKTHASRQHAGGDHSLRAVDLAEAAKL